MEDNEDQGEPWRTAEDTAKKRRKNRRKKEKKEEEEKVRHQQTQPHLHRRVNTKPQKMKMEQKLQTAPMTLT